MNLKYFPLDRQLCSVEIESCNYQMNLLRVVIQYVIECLYTIVGFTTSEITYQWVDSPKAVSIFPEVELPQFQIMGYRKRNYTYYLTTGYFSLAYIHTAAAALYKIE